MFLSTAGSKFGLIVITYLYRGIYCILGPPATSILALEVLERSVMKMIQFKEETPPNTKSEIH